MKFSGYFSRRFEPPAPFIRVLLVTEELGVRRFVDFLIDTGASVTILLDRDLERLRLDLRRLRRAERDVGGIGGFINTYQIDKAHLYLRAEDGKLHKEILRLHVGMHNLTKLPKAARAMVMAMPSLLGRDMIYRFKLFLNQPENKLYLES